MRSEELNLEAIKKSLVVNEDSGWSADVVRALVEDVERLRCCLDDLERAREFVRMKASLHERAAVVAWLREVAPSAPTRRGADELAWCSDAIERGEHRREEGR